MSVPDGYYVIQKSGNRFRQWYKLVAGTNITLTPDAVAHELAIIAAGGGGGGASWGKPYPLDIPPGTPNAKDDEFDGTSSVIWTPTPSAATATNINPLLAPSILEIVQSGSGNFQGLMQAVPGSYPYTITACLAYTDMLGANDRGGMLFIAPAAPTLTSQAIVIGRAAQVGFAGAFQLNGTFTNVVNPQVASYNRLYVRIRVNSATSVDSWFNEDGSGWIPRHVAVNPGFTPGVMGMAASRGSGTMGSRAMWDWFRVT